MNKTILSLCTLALDFLIILLGYLLCTEIKLWQNIFSASVFDFLPIMAGCLMVCSFTAFCFDYLFQKIKYVSASFLAFKFIQKLFKNIYYHQHQNIEKKFTYAFFLIVVKLVFIPLMIQFSAQNFLAINHSIHAFFTKNSGFYDNWVLLFNNSFYPLLLTLFFFIDTVFYLFGYLIYNEALDNKIRSVETTFLGWFSALICYPPFYIITAYLLPSFHNDYPFTITPELTAIIRVVMLFLIFIYTLSTINLGWKCSNLTNRGIVSHGVYSVVRHPAYIAKNLFWWVSLLPVMFIEPMSILYTLGLSGIYFFRAITEERHLYKDPDYVSYCKKVKYRFIPKIL